MARHTFTRRCNVRTCPSWKRPGFCRCKNSKTVLASSPGLSSNNFCTSSQTSMNGSGRVRPRTAAGNSLGNRSMTPVLPRCLRVHPCLGRRNLLAFLCLYQRKQPPNLLVRDQSASAPMNRNTLGLIVVGSGILFVVDREF